MSLLSSALPACLLSSMTPRRRATRHTHARGRETRHTHATHPCHTPMRQACDRQGRARRLERAAEDLSSSNEHRAIRVAHRPCRLWRAKECARQVFVLSEARGRVRNVFSRMRL
jgi:hypothetical protein